MAAFDEEQKRFVVRCWAYRMASSEILTEFAERFPDAPKPPSSQIALYKPCNKAGTTLCADLKQLFDETREHADSELEEIDGFHLSFRLRELTELYRMAKKQRATVTAKSILEQIAREKGGMYQRPVAGSGGAPGIGSGAVGAAGAGGHGSGDADRAAELDSLLDALRARKDRDTPQQGVSGDDAKPGTSG